MVGSVQGNFKKAFEKISKLQAKQKFDLAIIVGDVFGSATNDTTSDDLRALLNGQIHIPLPTYFTIGDSAFPDVVRAKLEADEDVCPNLLYLGRKGTTTTIEGVKLVALGGRQIQNETSVSGKLGSCDPQYLDNDARGLHGAHSAHILITNQWPANVTNGSKVDIPPPVNELVGAQSISNLCEALKPWYHFSSSPQVVWEREPFKQTADYDSLEQPAVTRFKSLPSVTAPTKEWMSAFSLDTSRPPTTIEPPTISPFSRASPPRKRPSEENPSYERYPGAGRRHKRPRNDRNDPNDCFMCLNKPEFKTHLVVSIGEESIVTASRGPLSTMSTFPQLSSSGHVMIIPHYHAADEAAQGRRPAEEVTAEFKEMSEFRRALNRMVGSKSSGQLGTVCWEVNRTGIRHHHWSLIPCPAEQVKKGLIDAAFKVSREQQKYPAFGTCDPDSQLPIKSDYFRVWTWASDPIEIADQTNGNDGTENEVGVTKSIYFPLPAEQRFNIWFGREVMAGLLQLEDRLNWRDALLRKDGSEQVAEEEDAQGLRDDFEEFDFAMK